MKVVMIYDQIQSGAGIKDDHMVPLGINKGATGPAIMMENYFKNIGATVIACLYCGDGFYEANPDEVSRKLCAMVTKLQADVVICGPCFDYKGYANMAAKIAIDINEKTTAQAFAAMAVECLTVVDRYKSKVNIVRMPKKGAGGLNQSLQGMCELAQAMLTHENENTIIQKYCY